MQKKRVLIFSILSVLLLVIAVKEEAMAQKEDDLKDYIPTPNTVVGARPDPKKQGPKEKGVVYIITNDTRKTLAGNACFEEVTRKMGFMYVAIPKGQPPYKNGFARWFHNFGAKFIVMLKNGPFWKARVNNKYRKCRHSTGDFAG